MKRAPAASPLVAANVLFLGALRGLFKRGPSYKTIGGAEAAALRKERKAVVVDVREPAEWRAGHVAGAKHIPLARVGASLDSIPRDRPVILVCASGMRSARAARLLVDAGYPEVYNLRGGWRAFPAGSDR